ncbi:hypothetical protein [Segnochrobactrum spirostomi]|uniref:Uncharacterized protein n=1 Tax=Segnochrobactrum spirostomi TaxID=2608987 RepID=A0A6A7Y6G8_9HYPH|nr:hypothetical protein [Segnochrobactrum spirostomi]MQT13671.1 hypothetical protein [Segnochrobactrum spirostomi]
MSAREMDFRGALSSWYRDTSATALRRIKSSPATAEQVQPKLDYIESMMKAAELLCGQGHDGTEIGFVEGMTGFLVGYALSTMHDEVCKSCITDRINAYAEAVAVGFQRGLDLRNEKPLS